MSFGSFTSYPSLSQAEEETEPEYCGSLPAHTVKWYEQRLDEISEDLDEVNVEELKEFVLGAHRQAGYGEASIDDSIGAIAADTNLKRLDDFTALVTATILQSLPYLSRLHYLLRTWSVRIDILRSTPSYLRDLAQARTDLDHGWAALAVSNHPAAATAMQRANATFSQEIMLEMKDVVQKQVSSLGRRLDVFLDLLEGRQETVPENWIENFEELEQQYGAWVVQAERKVLEGQWKTVVVPTSDAAILSGAEKEVNGPAMAAQDPPTQAPVDVASNITVGSMITSAVVVSTALGTGTDTTTQTTSTGPRSTTVTTVTPRSSANTQTQTSVTETGTDSNRSSTIQTTPSTNSSPRKSRSRHVPIVVDDYANEYSMSFANGAQRGRSIGDADIPPVPSLSNQSAINKENAPLDVKKRAAFLNGDIEKSESLNKSKPAPIVRPFEHASNAFTRLFKRERSEERPSRSSSTGTTGSKRSLGRKSSRSKMGHADLGVPSSARSDQNDSVPDLPAGNRPRTPQHQDPRGSEYVDLARVPPRSSSERPRSASRPKTPKTPKDAPAMAPEYTNRPRSSSKRSSKQNITALPGGTFDDSPLPPVVVEREGPETYLPTGLGSAFQSPIYPDPGLDMPENWPLSGEVTPAQETGDPLVRGAAERDPTEATSSERVWSTDTFEDIFISSMPATPRRPTTSGINAANERETRFGDFMPTPVMDERGDGDLFYQQRPPADRSEDDLFYLERPLADRSLLRTGRSLENLVIEDVPDDPLPRPVSTVLETNEEHSSKANVGLDSPDPPPQQNATEHDGMNAAAYFGSAERSVPDAIPSSSKKLPYHMPRSKSTPPVSPMVLRLRIPSSSSPEQSSGSEREVEGDTGLIRRASTASIESFPRSKLRAVTVKTRNSSGSVNISGPQTPAEVSSPTTPQDRPSMDPFTPTSPLHYKDDVWFPSPPSVPVRGSSLEMRRSQESRRSVDANDMSTFASRAKGKKAVRPMSPKSVKGKQPLHFGADNFDRHVSEVVNRVHASNIKFKSRPGASTPLPHQRSASGKLPKAAEQSAQKMTLAPADPSPKKSNVADPEVKLYHLTQAGRSDPIKLYVRLVGEGERVMVRVGGGWADLADYLRQYAEHHGSRTVSENVELQTVTANSSTPASANGFAKRTFSGPAALDGKANVQRRTSITSTPKDVGQDVWHPDDQPRFTMGESDGSGSPSPIVSRQDAAGGSGYSSRPSTGYSNTVPAVGTPLHVVDSAEASPAGSLSMAGPGGSASSSRFRADLPEQKARWVEGMIEKVNKSASAEKGRGFNEMGKVGGTRRMVFRKSDG